MMQAEELFDHKMEDVILPDLMADRPSEEDFIRAVDQAKKVRGIFFSSLNFAEFFFFLTIFSSIHPPAPLSL